MNPNIEPKDYQAKAGCLKEKVILITGASDGIGKEAAKTFSSFGAETILIGKNQKKLEETYKEINDLGYVNPMLHEMNLLKSKETDYMEVISAVENEYGRLDGLLCNAGILGSKTTLSQYKYETWKEVNKVNLDSSFLMAKHSLPLMKKQENASIIFTSSGVGRVGRAYWGAYSISKFGIESLTQIFSDELETTSNIRVNCINPGATQTSMRKEAYPAEDPNNLAKPSEIMNAYLYLMSDESLGFSGKSIDAQ